MSTVDNKLQKGLNRIIELGGIPIRIRRFTKVVGSVWDDDITLTSGTDTWTSGIVFSVNNLFGTSEATLLEQGLIRPSDRRIYVSGGVSFTGSTDQIKIGLGSPPLEEYHIVPVGVNEKEVAGTIIYKKAFIRRLTNGSFIGE